jgi:dephospho-CoA kinase
MKVEFRYFFAKYGTAVIEADDLVQAQEKLYRGEFEPVKEDKGKFFIQKEREIKEDGR